MSVRRIVISLFAVALSSAFAAALTPSEMFRWEVGPPEGGSTASVAAGDTLWIVAALAIAPDHYAYAERTSVGVEPTAGLHVGDIIASKPHLAYDQFEGREVTKYFDKAQFRIPILADSSLAGRTVGLTLILSHQGCSQTTCYFPQTEKRTISIAVRQQQEGAPQLASARPVDTPNLKDFSGNFGAEEKSLLDGFDVGSLLGKSGIILALAIMFVGGVLTSFTPCVYPLIPITVSLFGAVKVSAVRGFLLSVVFVLGMATMYSILGVSAAATGAVFGSVVSSPIVVVTIAVIFLVFAASMFGAFEIRLPAALQARLGKVGGAGFGGSFAAGLVAGVIAAPCTGPVLGAALTYVAATGDLSFGFLAMFSFALGMGLLFILIGTFSARIVPRSGPWLEKIRSAFGIIMILAALYFLKDVFEPLKHLLRGGTTALVVSLALVALGLLSGAFHARFVAGYDREGNLEPKPTAFERTRKALGILFVVAGLYGVIGFFIVPRNAPHGADLSSRQTPDWVMNEATGLARAEREGKPVLIDAYADWCVACRELDAYTYRDKRVLERLRDFVAIKLDLTNPSPEDRMLIEKYGIVGLPTVIILDRTGKELTDRRIVGFVKPEEFLRKLDGVR